jgi:hypothetical protein
MSQNTLHQKEESSDLFPEEMSQTKRATAVTTQAKQANQHDGKQNDVGSCHGYEGKFVASSIDNLTV